MEFLVPSYKSHPIKTVCILGGSKLIGHIRHVYMVYQSVKELGKYKIDILYGGSNYRFLGYLLDPAQNERISVTSALHFPKVRTSSIGGSTGLMLQAQSLHDNLMYMVNNSDAFIVLLGGYGTLNEIFNITSWAERDFHTKPIGLLNINNFFNDLLAFLDQGVNHKFISQSSRDILICADTVADLLIKFQAYISVKNLEVKAHQPQTNWCKTKKKSRSFRSFIINPDVRGGRVTEFYILETHPSFMGFICIFFFAFHIVECLLPFS
ncbi:hypothetical protein OROGR_021007 [Orobanche gracilis]